MKGTPPQQLPHLTKIPTTEKGKQGLERGALTQNREIFVKRSLIDHFLLYKAVRKPFVTSRNLEAEEAVVPPAQSLLFLCTEYQWGKDGTLFFKF